MNNEIKENQQRSVIKNTYEPGQVFGCFKIIERQENPTHFEVCCVNCNLVKILSQASLVHNRKSNTNYCTKCKPITANKSKYCKGEVIGNCFQLIEFLGKERWQVSCTKCGKIQEQSMSNMRGHKGHECFYCKNPNAQRNHDGGKGTIKGTIEQRVYRYYKARIDKDNETKTKVKPWNLDFDDFAKLIRANCNYCGTGPREDNMWSRNKRKMSLDEDYSFNGIDRIDSDLGYDVDNCVPCCITCNAMKSDLNLDSFFSQISKIYNFNLNNKRSTTSLNDVAPSGSETSDTLSDGSEGNDIV